MTLSLTLGQRETCNVTEAEAALGVSFEAVYYEKQPATKSNHFSMVEIRGVSDIECGREQC